MSTKNYEKSDLSLYGILKWAYENHGVNIFKVEGYHSEYTFHEHSGELQTRVEKSEWGSVRGNWGTLLEYSPVFMRLVHDESSKIKQIVKKFGCQADNVTELVEALRKEFGKEGIK